MSHLCSICIWLRCSRSDFTSSFISSTDDAGLEAGRAGLDLAGGGFGFAAVTGFLSTATGGGWKHQISIKCFCKTSPMNRQLTGRIAQLFKHTLPVRGVWGPIPRRVKLAVSPTARTVATFLRSCVAQALSRADGLRQSLHALAHFREYNESLLANCFNVYTKIITIEDFLL